MLQQWKTIEGWPYSVSSEGRIRNDRTGRIRKPTLDTGGYPGVNLSVDGKGWRPMIHKLVAAAFLGKQPEGMEVNHKDGRKQNSSSRNLEYVTHADNEKHASFMGLKARGERNSKAKLTEGKVRTIRILHESGLTQANLGKVYGVSSGGIGHIISRRNWKHVT